MELKIKFLVVIIFFPFLMLFINSIALRIFRNISAQIVTLRCIIAGNVIIIAIIFLLSISIRYFGENVADMFSLSTYCIIVCSLLSYIYFHIFNMSETARRIRILYEIYNKGAIVIEDIKGQYTSEDMISIRLERLIALRQIVCENNKYLLNKKFLYIIAKTLLIWRHILGYYVNKDAIIRSDNF